MKDKVAKLKEIVIKAASNPKFIHHKWFVKYHLDFVEKISLELCNFYPEANKDLVLILVWLHDYGKMSDFPNQYERTIEDGRNILTKVGFPEELVSKTLEYLKIIDSKLTTDINLAPIEVKIVSSADGASHLVGPFFSIWWYENADKPIEELMEGNKQKTLKDWNKKIVLPEVKKLFELRHKLVLEQNGEIPETFF